MHADDTSIQYSFPSITEILVNIQEDMNAICMRQYRNANKPKWAAEASVMLNGTRERVSGQKIDVTVDNQTCTQGII